MKAYTIGNAESYDLYLSAGGPCIKLGKNDKYDGGFVCKSIDEAVEILKWYSKKEQRNTTCFSIYELELPDTLKNCTYIKDGEYFFRLLKDAKIITKAKL